jgi:hypothetical protein
MTGLKQLGFMDFPGEIRNNIHALVIPTDEDAKREPSILRVNRQMRDEFLPLFYGNNTFEHRCELSYFNVSKPASYVLRLSITAPLKARFGTHKIKIGIVLPTCDANIHLSILMADSSRWLEEEMRKGLEPWAKANLGKDLTWLDLFAAAHKIKEITSKVHGIVHSVYGGFIHVVLSSEGLLWKPYRWDTP